MQRVTLTNNLTNYEKSRSVLNLMVDIWFVKAKAKVDKSSNATRKKKWAKLDPYEMNILIPLSSKGKYYLVDRPAGLLLAHQAVPSLTWARFVSWMNENYPLPDPDTDALKDIVQNGTSAERIQAALADSNTWEGISPSAWITVDENKDDVILIAGPPITDREIVSLIKKYVLRNKEFQSAVYTYNTPPDDGKPAYYTASLVLKDEAFPANARTKTVYVVNLGQFKPSDDDNDDTGSVSTDPDAGASDDPESNEAHSGDDSTGTGDDTETSEETSPQDDQPVTT